MLGVFPPSAIPTPTGGSDRISKHISYLEATKSETAIRRGISNIPDTDILARMRITAAAVFEPVREHFGKPLFVTSFFRNPVVNRLAGGSSTSQHMTGEAIDIDGDPTGIPNTEILQWIRKNLDFDQLIWEFSNPNGTPAWVHVSYRPNANRQKVVRAVKREGSTVFIPI